MQGHLRSIFLLFLAVLAAPRSVAQPLQIAFSEVDFGNLPLVSFKVCVQQNGSYLRGLDSTNFVFTENGVPHDLDIHCPDPFKINSVAMVLDNSGSMQPTISKLVEAARMLVDSLGTNDEGAIMTFGRNIDLRQDFTTDKGLLDTALMNMVANGGTPLFDACDSACRMLGARSGNRFAVVITDGQDNLSSRTLDDVIMDANLNSVRMYTIAFNIQPPYDTVVRRMAVETGGQFYSISRPSELTAVYETIAGLITEKCCIAQYITSPCADSMRTLSLSVRKDGSTGAAVQIFNSPARPTSFTLSPPVPKTLTPLATDRGYIRMVPPPSTALGLTLQFTLVYDDNLVDIPILPFTLGTVTQNQVVTMQKIAPGEMQFDLSNIKPALSTTTLVGFPVQALVSDSSRKVGFTIKDVSIGGCPSSFIIEADSMIICQCFRPMYLLSDTTVVAPPLAEVRIPMQISGGLEPSITVLFSATLRIPDGLTFVAFEQASQFPAGAVQWGCDSGMFMLHMDQAALPLDTSGFIGVLVLRTGKTKEAQQYSISTVVAELWQRCCPMAGDYPTLTILQDGICTPLVVARASSPSLSAAPNPFSLSGGGMPALVVNIPDAYDGKRFSLKIFDLLGNVVLTLADKELGAGVHEFQYAPKFLAGNSYIAVLEFEGQRVSKSLLYLR